MQRGEQAENTAAGWLTAMGLVILQRNFRCRCGEIDIIAREGEVLVFVEVRLRSHPGFAGAHASVDPRKQRRLIRAAQVYLQRHPRWAGNPCRFDVIGLKQPQSVPGPDAWIRAAFTT